MKAEAVQLFKVLQGGRQYRVPIYQRTYSWGQEQVERLWSDVLEAGREGRPHFTGSVVYVTTSDDDMADVTQALLIDGQQRLTTTVLFLVALVRRLHETGGFKVEKDGSTVSVTAENLRKNLLVNPDVSGLLHHKLVLTQRDRDTLSRLLDSLEHAHTPLPADPSPRVLDTLNFFTAQLQKPGVDLAEVYAGLQRLQVVRIALKAGEDDPQLIFDSMNSTGMDLTEADRIRNYVLMKFAGPAQEKLYADFWFPMERQFEGAEPDAFDRFIRDYLSLHSKNPVPARLNEVYRAFKHYVEKEQGTPGLEPLVRDLAQAARYYAALLNPEAHEKDSEVKRALLSLRSLDLDVWYPLVLDAYTAWQTGELPQADFLGVLSVLETYLYRRWVCGVGTQGLNKFFPALPGQLRGHPYLQAFQDQLYQQRSYLRFPTDDEFSRELTARDLYTRRTLSRYTLGRLENFGSKEPVNPGNYTIEHILPQNKNLSAEWRAMLGEHWQEVQGRYLHTLGNLTLTGYNAEYSDRPFLEKRDLMGSGQQGQGFKSSHLLLNQELAELSEWNEQRIQERAQRLVGRALLIWPMVTPSPELLAAQTVRSASRDLPTLDRHLHNLAPALRVRFDELRELLLGLPDVEEVPTTQYVAYKIRGTNFCDVVPQPALGTVKCWLNLPFPALDDPHGLARDVTHIGRAGNGNAEVVVRPDTSLDAFFELVQQALNYQLARTAVAPAPAPVHTVADTLAQLSGESITALGAFEQALLDLDPQLTRYTTQYYVGYGRPLLVSGVPRSGMIRVEVQPRDPDVLPAEVFAGWEARSRDRWTLSLVSPADAERALPLVRAAHAQMAQGLAYRQPQVRQLAREMRDLFAALGEEMSVQSTRTSDRYLAGQREIARAYVNSDSVFLALRRDFGTLDNPTGRGQPVDSGFIVEWGPGYFADTLTQSADLEDLRPLIRQAYEAS